MIYLFNSTAPQKKFLDFSEGRCYFVLMKSINIYSLGIPPAFSRTPTDANYWQERYAYERSYNLYLMSEEDIEFQQVEVSDHTASETELTTWLSSYNTWAENAIQQRKDDLPVPEAPAFPVLADNTGQLGLINLLAKLSLQMNLTLFRFGGSGELDSEDMKAVLEDIKDILELALIYEEDSVDKSILKTAYLDVGEEDELISLLWAYATQPVEVWVGNNGGIENISYVTSRAP